MQAATFPALMVSLMILAMGILAGMHVDRIREKNKSKSLPRAERKKRFP